MNESEVDIRKLCCTCLNSERKLVQLSGLLDGVNNLYWLLSHDVEAYKEGFYKDLTNLYICWECKAIMTRICKFRSQVCTAQKQLSNIEDGRSDYRLYKTLSKLSVSIKNTYDQVYDSCKDPQNYIFIDCGLIVGNIKTESDDDIPIVSELNDSEINLDDDDFNTECQNADDIKLTEDTNDIKTEETTDIDKVKPTKAKKKLASKEVRKKQRTETKRKRKTDAFSAENRKHYTIDRMTSEELLESRDRKRLLTEYVNAPNKCESCVEGYKSEINFQKHMDLHEEKANHTQCEICLLYIRNGEISEHVRLHYEKYLCNYCKHASCDVTEVLRHLKKEHNILDVVVPKRWKKGERKTPFPKNPGSRPRRSRIMMDKRTALGYRCSECDQYFEDKKQRWMHVQKMHREGFRCSTCGKRFSFKNHLQKHERIHQGPAERTACPQCGKLIQTALLSTHARLHMPRTPHTCVECDKRFVSKESYQVHLKYSSAHAKDFALKFKCDLCEKGYRSKVELADHINYVHMGKTQHKCPVCDKALASRRCVARHVRRAHVGRHEHPRDYVCQLCGRTFRDKKGLREHERIHTGERPLSCEICGCTFRQNASLYTHKKRVHKIYPQKKTVQVVEGDTAAPVMPATTRMRVVPP